MPPYRYDDYRSPYVGTLGSLIGEEGRIRAQAALQQGQARAQMVQGIGQAVTGAVQDVAQYRADEPRRQMLALQFQNAQEEARARQQARAEAEQAKHAEVAARIGMRVHLEGNTPEALQGAFNDLERARLITADDVQRMAAIANQDPSKIPQLSQSLMALSPSGQAFLEKLQKPHELMSVDPTHNVVDKTTNQVVIAGTPKLEPRKTAAELAADAANPASPTQAQSATALDLMRPPKEPPKPPAAGTFEDYVLRGAKALGKPLEALTPADIEDFRKKYQQADDRPRITVNTGNPSDVKEAVAGMKDGTLPPQMPGRASKDYTAILAEARRQGFDLAKANLDWTATQKHVATMNGAQQLRLNQAVNALPEMLDKVDALASQWKGGQYPVLNKANLALAKGGAYGPEAASIANQLDAQIADVVADLGNVYMGGNSPTDHALNLAGKSLKGEWDEKVLHDMVKLAKTNVTIRRHSIDHTGVAGASPDNPYALPEPPAPRNVAAGPDLTGLAPGHGRTFSEGPFAGQTWTIGADGKSKKVK